MQYLRGSASVKRILEIWDTKSEIDEPEEPIKDLKNGSISFKNVCFSYPGSPEKNFEKY